MAIAFLIVACWRALHDTPARTRPSVMATMATSITNLIWCREACALNPWARANTQTRCIGKPYIITMVLWGLRANSLYSFQFTHPSDDKPYRIAMVFWGLRANSLYSFQFTHPSDDKPNEFDKLFHESWGLSARQAQNDRLHDENLMTQAIPWYIWKTIPLRNVSRPVFQFMERTIYLFYRCL